MPYSTNEKFKAVGNAPKLAFPSWRNTGITSSEWIMFKLEQLICRDMGIRGLKGVHHVRGAESLQMGEFVSNVSNGIDTHQQPLGVSSGISHFSFLAMIPLWMFPVVVKCEIISSLSHRSEPGSSMDDTGYTGYEMCLAL